MKNQHQFPTALIFNLCKFFAVYDFWTLVLVLSESYMDVSASPCVKRAKGVGSKAQSLRMAIN